jgi:hypothetical protein
MEIGSTLRDEDGWNIAENRMLRQEWEGESWRKVHTEKFWISYLSQNIISVS